MSLVWILHGWDLCSSLSSRYANLDIIAEKGCSGICALYECNEFQNWSELASIDQCFLQVSGLLRWNRFPNKEKFPLDTIYGLRTAVLTTDENLVKHKSLLYPFTVWLITETDQDSLTRQLWKYCSELLRSTPDRQHTSTTTFDLVLVYLKNRTNQVILHVANVVTGNLLSISPQVPFLGVLGFDPNWKKSFEELVSFKDCPVPFMPRQSFQSVDELILEKQCFHHNTHLWASFYKEGFTRCDHVCRFLPEECFSLGCNRVILAEHLIYEIAFLLEKLPKYGS